MLMSILLEYLSFILVSVLFGMVFNVTIKKHHYFLFPILSSVVNVLSCTFIDSLPIQHLQLLKPFILILVYTVVLHLMFHVKILSCAVYSFIVLIISGLSNALALVVFYVFGLFPADFDTMSQNEFLMNIGTILVIVFDMLILGSAMLFVRRKALLSLFGSKRAFYIVLSTLLMFLINIGVYPILMRSYELNIGYIVFAVIVQLFYTLFMLFVFYRFQKHELVQADLNQQKFYNDSLLDAMENLQRFKHDIGNNLAVLSAMIQTNKFDQAKQYMSDMMNFNSNVTSQTTLLKIRNAAINGLISSKISHAEKMNVNINVIVMDELHEIVNVNMMDLCEVLGILIDNAIEAVAGKSDNDVDISIDPNETQITFMISNTLPEDCDYNIIKAGNTSKGEGRGKGLTIVNNIIKKSKCMLLNTHFEDDTSMFDQELIINQ